jgi:hypothetical protein
VPVGVTSVKATVYGGGGGSSGNCDSGGYPGGRGGIAIGYVTVTPGASITVTVGSGGAGGGLCTNGGNGGASSFGSTLSATGGQGGQSELSAGSNGIGSGSDLNAALLFASASFGVRSSGGSSAVAFALGSPTPPGSGGFNSGNGGVGGAVFLEW